MKNNFSDLEFENIEDIATKLNPIDSANVINDFKDNGFDTLEDWPVSDYKQKKYLYEVTIDEAVLKDTKDDIDINESSASLPELYFSEMPGNGEQTRSPVMTLPNPEITQSPQNLNNPSSQSADRDITEYECAQMVMKIIFFMVRHEELYYFKSPIFVSLTEKKAISLIKSIMPKEILRSKTYFFWKGVVKQIESTAHLHYEGNIPYRPEEIVFNNGVYNVNTKNMRDATPYDYFLSCNDVDFHPNHHEDGRVVEDFFNTFSAGDEEIQRLAWTVIGCILSQGNHFRKFFMFYGAPAAGKSLLGMVIEELVGKQNCSHIPLNKIGTQFYSARLNNKQLNSCLDLSYTELKDIGMLKLLTSGMGDKEETSVKYGGFVTLETDRIKMLFACNKLPRVSEDEYARPYYDRMVLVPFLHSMPPDQRDPALKDRLLEQTNYIIQKALKYYKKLLKHNNQFPECSVSKAILDKELGEINTVEAFARACCDLDTTSQEANEDLYNSYLQFCGRRELVPESYNHMIQHLRENYNLPDGRVDKQDGRRPHATKGIRLKKSQYDQTDHD